MTPRDAPMEPSPYSRPAPASPDRAAAARERALWRTLLDASPDALVAYDTELRVIEWPATTARNTGIARADAIGRSVLDLFPYVRGTPIEAEYRRSLAGEVVDGRERLWTATGAERPRYFDVSYHPLRDEDGTVVGGVVVTADVTARREGEEAHAAERRLLRTILDSAPHSLIAVDRELRVVEWNAYSERNSGLRRSEVLGRPIVEVLPNLPGSEALRDYERALAGEARHVRDRWFAVPGAGERCYDATFSPMYDGRGVVNGVVVLSEDVTERALAERALRDERAFLRSVVDAAPAAIVAFDRDLRQTEWNPAAERNTGIRRAEALGRTNEELFPGFTGSAWHDLVRRMLAGETLGVLDYEQLNAQTHDARTLDVTLAPLRDGTGGVAGGLVISLDVTARVAAQRALAESEARYRQLFDETPAMQLLTDVETGRIVDANAAAVAFYGYPREQLIGMRPGELLADARGARGAGRRTEVTATGERREVEGFGTVLVRDGRRLLHDWMIDVTERVRAETERDRLTRIVEATTDLVATGDVATGLVTYMNRAGRELLGIAEPLGRLMMRDCVAAPDHALVFEQAVPTALREGTWRGDLRLLSRDGRLIPSSVVLMAHDVGGGATLLSTVSRDMTEEKSHEAELDAARDRAERASQAKTAMLAGLSHELRTPLGAVIGFAQMLRDRRAGPLTAEQAEYLDDVLGGASHLLRVVNDALDLARVEAGAVDLRPEPVELRGLVGQALGAVAHDASARGITLAADVPDEAARLVADPARIRQVLLNYLSNAIKYGGAGGRVTVEARAEPGFVRLTVRDTGPGIAAADLPRLFEEFQRFGTDPDIPGSGLGLAITRRLVVAMGGTVWAESTPGLGTAFHARIPRQPRA